MSHIATDVVLLPDATMTEKAIAANKALIGDDAGEIALGSGTCLPHISLAMGCIDEADVDAIGSLLQKLARKVPVRQLQVVGTVTSTNSRGQRVTLLEVEKAPGLQMLHESVMEELRPFFRYEVSAAMICDDAVAETTLEWIRHYRRHAAFERFQPHMTIGYGPAPTDMPFPLEFGVSALALCHLGNHCTCRRVLAAASLS